MKNSNRAENAAKLPELRESANVLIAEDSDTNRLFLADLISLWGHNPIEAENGLVALEKIEEAEPDIILLDIVMPKMDGHEVLKRVRENFYLRHIPIVVVSALNDMEGIARCIEQGADDYLIKPINQMLLKARLDACLERKYLSDLEESYLSHIETQNEILEQKLDEKTLQIQEANEKLNMLNQAKNDFLRLIAHEMNSPLNGLLGPVEIIMKEGTAAEDRKQMYDVYKQSFNKLSTIVEQALLLAHIETSNNDFLSFEMTSLNILTTEAREACLSFAKSRDVIFNDRIETDLKVTGDHKLLVQAFTALIKTAIRFAKPGTQISLGTEEKTDENSAKVILNVCAKGYSVPEHVINKFFDVFSVNEPMFPGADLGLDPPVAERIISLCNGNVAIANHDKGITLSVEMRAF